MRVNTRIKTQRAAYLKKEQKAFKVSMCKGHRISLDNGGNTYILRVPAATRKQKRVLTIDTDKFSIVLDGRQINSLRRLFKKAERAEII